jgi:hypothetical protein
MDSLPSRSRPRRARPLWRCDSLGWVAILGECRGTGFFFASLTVRSGRPFLRASRASSTPWETPSRWNRKARSGAWSRSGLPIRPLWQRSSASAPRPTRPAHVKADALVPFQVRRTVRGCSYRQRCAGAGSHVEDCRAATAAQGAVVRLPKRNTGGNGRRALNLGNSLRPVGRLGACRGRQTERQEGCCRFCAALTIRIGADTAALALPVEGCGERSGQGPRRKLEPRRVRVSSPLGRARGWTVTTSRLYGGRRASPIAGGRHRTWILNGKTGATQHG